MNNGLQVSNKTPSLKENRRIHPLCNTLTETQTCYGILENKIRKLKQYVQCKQKEHERLDK